MDSVFDLRLAPKGGQANGQLQLVDRIVKMQKEKVNSLKQGEGAAGEFQIDNQLKLIQEILVSGAAQDENHNPVLNMIDSKIQGEDAIKRWALGVLRPFFLGLFNEQWVDYSQLIVEEAKR